MKRRITAYKVRSTLILALLMLLLGALAAIASIPSALQNDGVLGGLAQLPQITKEAASLFPESLGGVKLTLSGEQLPYDAASNTYFIPQSAQTDAFEGVITVEKQPGLTYYLLADEDCDKQTALMHSLGYTVYALGEGVCFSSRVLFTSVPVLSIATDSGAEPGDADEGAQLVAFEMKNGALTAQRLDLSIRIRGNTSRWFPKKSYRLKVLDEQGGKQHVSLAGMRYDDDWILNPMYSDTSKIREMLAYELWDEINTSGKQAASSRMTHVEVFLNGQYWGLYGLQERIDSKQVNGDKTANILYKVATNDRPTVDELLACTSLAQCRAFEAQYGESYGFGSEMLWKPAAAYMAMLGGEPLSEDALGVACKVDLTNAVEYGIWAMLTQAHDCHFKNQYLHAVPQGDGYTMYKIPWDVNHTFGDVWRGEQPETNYSGYMVGSLVMDSLFEQLVASGDETVIAAIRERWTALRSGAITQEALTARAEELYRTIYAAVQRDSIRWPTCGMGEGNALNVLDIESYFEKALPRIDAFVAGL